MKKILLLALLILIFNKIEAQNYKFGKVSKEELVENIYKQDSTANAVYLLKKRITYPTLIANKILLITEVHVRIKIYNKEGFKWATEKISLFKSSNSDSEKITSLKAYTYNFIDGEVIKDKLDKKNVFKEEKSKNFNQSKFTMPNVKEGSVLEWTYKINSPFYSSIDDVVVQYEIPVKKYETKLVLLEWLKFNKRQKGYYRFNIVEESKTNHDFDTRDNVIIVTEENVPAIKNEPYVDNIDNYAAGLNLEIASFIAPRFMIYENYTTSWDKIVKDINKSSSFGGELKKTRHLEDDLNLIKSNWVSVSEKIEGSLQFVKDKIKWNDNYGKYTEKGLKKAYKEGLGNCADVNLTLVAVLRELGLEANPVLVSTRSNGIPLFPTKKGFNYVVAVVNTEEGKVLLDATEKHSIPNVLPHRAINWNGTIVKKDGTADFVKLNSDKLSIKGTNLSYDIDEEGFVHGMARVKYKNYSALAYRNKNVDLKEETIISELEQSNGNIELVDFRITNKENILKPVIEMYKFEKEDGADIIGDKIYITPTLFYAKQKNPFKLKDRKYPIVFGNPWEETIRVSLKIPEGFVVESIPENSAIGLSDNLGVFKYIVTKNGNNISIISVLKFNKSIIPASYYPEIKELYKVAINKNLEQIVLKKG